MQRIQLRIPRGGDCGGDVAIEVYGDLGSGSIDFEHPLPPGRLKLWPANPRRGGHLEEGHGLVAHLGGTGPDGHLEGDHLAGRHIEPRVALAVFSPRYVFGRFQHTVRAIDAAGNASTSAVVFAHTVNAAPRPPRNLVQDDWNEATRQLSFTFEPVAFAAHRGT